MLLHVDAYIYSHATYTYQQLRESLSTLLLMAVVEVIYFLFLKLRTLERIN